MQTIFFVQSYPIFVRKTCAKIHKVDMFVLYDKI